MKTLRSAEGLVEPGEIVGASWRAEERVAIGGMGEVWRGWHRWLPIPVAIKRLKPGYSRDADLVARFERESRTAAKMGELTSGAVRVFDAGFDRNGPFLVMEWLEGPTLTARLAEQGRFSLRETTRLLAAIAEVVRVAHAAHIVHRDLKMDNVVAVPLPNGRERVVVIDWGVVKILEPGGAPMPTLLAGSPPFMSPEVVNARPIDARADLWSLLVMLYAMVSGKLPFGGGNHYEVMRAVLEGDTVPPSSIHPRLAPAIDAFFSRGFTRAIEERYQTIDELESAFRAATRRATRGGRAAPPPPPVLETETPVLVSASLMGCAPTDLMATVCSPGCAPKEGGRE